MEREDMYLADGRFHFCPITKFRELFPERDCVLCREAQEAAWDDEAKAIEAYLKQEKPV